MNEIALAQEKSLKMIRELTGALLHESGVGMGCDPRNLHPPRVQFHDHQDIVGHQPLPGGDFDREKVCGREHCPMHLDKLCPAHASLASLRRWVQKMATEDVTHGDLVNVMTQISQCALDTAITPGRILFSHADNELFNLLTDARSAPLFSFLTAIELVGNQALVPAV